MEYKHYQLLTLQNAVLSGPLAGVIPPEMIPHTMSARALLAFSRMMSMEINVLGLRAGFAPSGEFHAEPTGLLAGGLGRKVADNVSTAIKNKGLPLLTRDGQAIYTLFQPPVPSAPIAKVLASRLSLERTGHPLPATHTMQITTACQCDCVHCSAARHRDGIKAILSTDECKSFIRQSVALGVVIVIFTGGEPLLRKDLCELIASVNPDEAVSMIFTNGHLLDKEHVGALKRAGLFSLMVSLDSPDPQEHDRMRGLSGCWQHAVDGIRRSLDAGLLCGISTYATPERLHGGQVREMIELGRRLGVHEITIFDVVPTGRLLRQDESALLSAEDKAELCALERQLNGSDGYPHIITQAHVNGPTGAGCYAAWFQLYSTAYGDVTPCDFTPISFGNVREEPLADIWARMTSHPSYCAHMDHCRMQDQQFRHQWIDRIPAAGPYPFPIAALDAQPEAEELSGIEELLANEFAPRKSSVGIRA